MAEIAAGAFLSATLELVFKQVISGYGYVYDFIKGKNINHRLLRKLRMKLLSASSLMDDAEAKQLKNPYVREWLAELKAAMYDADDLVDEIDAEALRYKIDSESASSLQQVLNSIPTPFNKHAIESKTKEIIDRLETILQEKDDLGLKGGAPKIPSTRTPETSLVEESGVYGRDDDKKVILQLLMSDEVIGNNKVSVIPIEGMGGIGKTTLARLIYNDDAVKNHFESKAWVCVSDDFNIFRITKEIFQSVTSRTCNISTNLNRVQEKLQQALVGKKFLIVLDDVWNEDYMEWDKLKIPLLCGACGSTIIVTTRNEKIANIMRTMPSHKLEVMLEADCWSLFVKHAFGNMEHGVHLELEEIGRDIVKKCKGLPLGVKTLGGLLRSEQNPQEWMKILKSDIWESLEKEHSILPSLWLSYYYLPPHLKRCFAYCSIFPKDYEFEKERLILLWMGENLLKPHENKSIEEVGEEYFNDLLSRSLFQGTKSGRFTMHDLINDLAKFVSCGSCLRLDEEVMGVADAVCKTAGKATRHLSNMRPHKFFEVKNLKDLCNVKILRTLILRDRRWDQDFQKDLVHLLESMQYLRVLEIDVMESAPGMKVFDLTANLKLLQYLRFDGVEIEEIPDLFCSLYSLQTLILSQCHCTKLPDSIGNLKQLRYLDLSGSKIAKIPDSIGSLENLRYLDLSHCPIEKLPDTVCNLHELRTFKLIECRLKSLPNSITMLINLRHLIFRNFLPRCFMPMPLQMWKWENLQTMPPIVLGRDTGANIKELGELQHLQGEVCIRGLENVANAEDAKGANLKDKKGITQLWLGWRGDSDDSQVAREVLDRLQPHTNLEKLEIYNYGGTSFPPWFGYESFSCLNFLKLSGCKNCTMLPALGQLPSLEDLWIEGFDMLEKIGNEFYSDDADASSSSSSSSSVSTKPFKTLKRLYFWRMPEWKEWSVVELVEGSNNQGIGAFSNLEELELNECPKLKLACLPEYLPSLHQLIIWKCENMKAFPERRLPSNIQSIEIWRCHELESFSEEGWPSNLASLCIDRCEKLFATKQWNLGMLSSLTSLEIKYIDEEVDTFPEEEGQLPTSLTSLRLYDMPNLRSLNGKAFQHLTSLKQLTLEYCQQLQCLPEETLPPSISEMWIYACPLLEPRCQRETGEDWFKILHIPSISIDWQHI